MSRLGAIFRAHGGGYRDRFGTRMSADQLRALRALAACHTPALGSVRWQCPQCQERVFTYRSCGNRHCPACGHADAQLWLQRQQRLLLPGAIYHLVTFTVPEGLRRPVRSHPREVLPLLFETAASALLTLCGDPRFLGAAPGLTAVLHTWTRQLEYHPHVHILATGGGLGPDGAWHEADPKFFVPVRALSDIFRARLRDAMRQRHPAILATIPGKVWQTPWVVHSKPVGAGDYALAYLARYIHRVALADSAILHHDDRQVVFRYRDGDTGQPRTARFEPLEFIRRFLQHVLPAGFRKVRHYGLHHSSKRKALRLLQAQLAFVRGLPLPPADKPVRTPLPPPLCPKCATPMCAEILLQPPLQRSPQVNARGPPGP
ncbi:MAG: transposase [Kiritimatiellaeota bacterium]|nr:transposase [Kiritimatiellota bacterium]